MIASRTNSLRTILGVVMIAALVSIVSGAANAEVTIVLREQFPVEGEPVELFVQGDTGDGIAGAEINVTYRPGSSVEKTEAVGTTNDSGRINWTPSTAGIAAINATMGDESASLNVSIRFGSTPWLGVIIMILAGLLLVGGSAVRIWRVARGTE